MLLEMPWSTPPPVDDGVDEVSLMWIDILKLTKHKIVAPAGYSLSNQTSSARKLSETHWILHHMLLLFITTTTSITLVKYEKTIGAYSYHKYLESGWEACWIPVRTAENSFL